MSAVAPPSSSPYPQDRPVCHTYTFFHIVPPSPFTHKETHPQFFDEHSLRDVFCSEDSPLSIFLVVLHNGEFYALVIALVVLACVAGLSFAGREIPTAVLAALLLAVASLCVFVVAGILMRLVYLVRGIFYRLVDIVAGPSHRD